MQLAAALLLQQPLLERQLFLQGLLLRPAFGFRRFDPGHLGDIHAHAEKAQPAGGVPEFELGRLKVAKHGSLRVRHILEEHIGPLHRQRLPVVLNEVCGGLGVKNLMVGQPNHVLRARFPGIFGKRLVAGEIDARLRVL